MKMEKFCYHVLINAGFINGGFSIRDARDRGREVPRVVDLFNTLSLRI
jgi:hypothetical protein